MFTFSLSRLIVIEIDCIKIAIDTFDLKHYEIRRFFYYIHEFALSSN